jgi:hypothetical protein
MGAEAAKLGSTAQDVQTAASQFDLARDLPAARAAFGAAGDAILRFAKESDASPGEGIEVAFCPMVQKHWLQRGVEIQNPFYGKQMLRCGRFVDSPF